MVGRPWRAVALQTAWTPPGPSRVTAQGLVAQGGKGCRQPQLLPSRPPVGRHMAPGPRPGGRWAGPAAGVRLKAHESRQGESLNPTARCAEVLIRFPAALGCGEPVGPERGAVGSRTVQADGPCLGQPRRAGCWPTPPQAFEASVQVGSLSYPPLPDRQACPGRSVTVYVA